MDPVVKVHQSAVVDKCCPENGCAAASLLSMPCQGQSGLQQEEVWCCQRVVFVVVRMKLDLSAVVGINIMFFKTDLGW